MTLWADCYSKLPPKDHQQTSRGSVQKMTDNYLKSIWKGIPKACKSALALFSHKHAYLPPDEIIIEVAERINKSGASLILKSKNSEKDFSNLGNGLFSFHKDISDLLSLINEIAGQIGEDHGGINSAGEVAGKALKSLDAYKNFVDQRSANMTAVSESLNKLFRLCDLFEKAAGFFRSVGLNIKIESRRSQDSHEMFGFISDEITPLSEKIFEIIYAIREDIETAKIAQQAASKNIASSLAEFVKMAENASNTVKESVGDIESLMALSKGILEKASENSRNISRQTGEVVMQIQFHDNMRQRIDHMSSSLNETEKRIMESISSRDKPKTKIEKIGSAYAIINLQNAQLASMTKEVEEVFHKSRNAFSEIMSNIDSLVNNLQTDEALAPETIQKKEKDQKPFLRLKESFFELSELMRRSNNITIILQEVMGTAATTAAKLSKHMEAVDRINTETHLIALNAIIKAAHLGTEGRTLEELAQTLVRLSGQINEIVSDVNIIISNTNEQIAELGSKKTNKKTARDWASLSDETNESENDSYLENTAQMLADEYKSFELKKAEALMKASNLSSAIAKTVKDIHFIEILSNDFGKIKSKLEDDLNTLKPWVQDPESLLAESAGNLAETYTMQQQREIHEKMLAPKASYDSAALPLKAESCVEVWDDIELFDSFDSNEENKNKMPHDSKEENEQETIKSEDMEKENMDKTKQTIKDDEFGDNVELF